MNDLDIEQIIKLGQLYFPQLDAEKIVEIFEKFKKLLPEGMSNLEIAQVIKKTIDEKKSGKQQFSKLSEMISNR